MYVKLICVEDARRYSSGASSKDVLIENPSEDDIRNAITAMDGENRTYVTLYPSTSPGETMVTVGGGEDGRFVVFYYDGDEWNLINPEQTSDGTVDILMGQTSTRSIREIVDRKTALRAAIAYAVTGTLASDLVWERQDL